MNINLQNEKIFKLILITPLFILLTHYLAVFPHEYAHSFVAWILGYKNNPFDLHYGGTSLNNLFLLSNIEENVNYKMIYSQGHGFAVALIAFAGPGIANGLLFILSIYLLKNRVVKINSYLLYFIFWFNLMNLGNFYDYVPIRTFASHGDMAAIEIGLNISPWWIYILFGYPVVILIWRFFNKTLPETYLNLNIQSHFFKVFIMIISVFILFGFFGGIIGTIISYNPKHSGDISYFLSLTSFFMIPGVIIAAWPKKV